jgi:hypothetical protein
MMVACVAQGAIENACAFITKHSFSFYALENVRTELEELIHDVALPHLGAFVSPIVSRELATIFSVSVTCLLAEMVSVAVKEAIRAIIDLASSYFGFVKPKGLTFFMREQALFIAGFVTGFLAKSYFCNNALLVVHKGCDLMLRHAVQLSAVPFPFSAVIPYLAIVAAPYVTFVLGDIIWTVIAETTEEIMDNALDLVGI